MICAHSRPQSPRSFWPVAGIESSGLVQYRKSAIHGLPVKSSSDWLRILNEYFAHAQKSGPARALDPFHRPEGSWALGTRMDLRCSVHWRARARNFLSHTRDI